MTNLVPEIKKNRSETAGNWFNIFNAGMFLIITIFTFVTNLRLENLKQEIETAKFMESTIDNLAGNSKGREIALSVLYSSFILEKQEQSSLKTEFNLFKLFDSHEIPHRFILIDLADTVLKVNYDDLSSGSSENAASSKAIDILCALKEPRCSYWLNQAKNNSRPSSKDKNKNEFANAIYNQSNKGQGKKGLVFIQYNDESKKNSIEQFRKENLSNNNWNAPGKEFIAEYQAPSGKLGDIRYFHADEKKLAQELQKILNDKYCPEEQCFGEPIDLSKSYPNLPEKQFEIWIDAKNKKIN